MLISFFYFISYFVFVWWIIFLIFRFLFISHIYIYLIIIFEQFICDIFYFILSFHFRNTYSYFFFFYFDISIDSLFSFHTFRLFIQVRQYSQISQEHIITPALTKPSGSEFTSKTLTLWSRKVKWDFNYEHTLKSIKIVPRVIVTVTAKQHHTRWHQMTLHVV